MDDPLQTEAFEQFEAALEDLRDCAVAAPDDNIAHLKQLQDLCGKLLEQMDTQRKETLESLALVSDRFASVKSLLSSESSVSAEWQQKAADWDTARENLQTEITSLKGELTRVAAAQAASNAAEEEAAQSIASLEARIKEAAENLQAKDTRLQELEQELASASSATAEQSALQENAARLREQLARLETEFSASEQTRKAAIEDLEEAREELARLRDQAKAAAAQQSEIHALRQRVEEAEKLQPALQDERRQRQAAEQRLNDEMSRGTKSMLAQQLAEALRDAEEAKDELRRLQGGDSIFGAIPPAAAAVGVVEVPEEFDLRRTDSPEAPSSAQDEGQRATQEAQIHAVLRQVRPGQKRSIGEILLEAGVITGAQLEEALEEQKLDSHHHLGAILIERGWVNEESVARVLASQVNAPYVVLNQQDIEPTAIALLSGRLAYQHTCVPMRYSDDRVTVAMVNPMDLVAIEDLERATGRGVDVVVSTNSQIQNLLDYYYGEAIA